MLLGRPVVSASGVVRARSDAGQERFSFQRGGASEEFNDDDNRIIISSDSSRDNEAKGIGPSLCP